MQQITVFKVPSYPSLPILTITAQGSSDTPPFTFECTRAQKE